MAWAGAGRSAVERRVVRSELRRGGIELVHHNAVGAEIVNEREAIVWGNRGAVRVRGGLPPGIRTVTGELELGDGTGNVSIGGNFEGENLAALVAC
jgi:hypothetical protein